MKLHVAKTAVIAALASTALAGMALPADASTASPASGTATARPSDWVPGKVHRGTVRCFSYSFKDLQLSVTIYYHNRCGSTQHIKLHVSHASPRCFTVKGHIGGHSKFTNFWFIPKVQKIEWVKKC